MAGGEEGVKAKGSVDSCEVAHREQEVCLRVMNGAALKAFGVAN